MESNNKFSKMMKVLFLGMCILLTGCSASQEEKQMDKTEESFVLKSLNRKVQNISPKEAGQDLIILPNT